LTACQNTRAEASRSAAATAEALKAQCQALSGQAYANGQLRVLQSIEIVGQPSREKGFLWDDHYYTFQVRVGGRTVVLSRIHTREGENAFSRLLSSIPELAMALGLRRH
jgi:hypothetical protein